MDRDRLVTFEGDDGVFTCRCAAIRGVSIENCYVRVAVGRRVLLIAEASPKHPALVASAIMKALIRGGAVDITDVIVSVEEG